jgi:hypothetical protein
MVYLPAYGALQILNICFTLAVCAHYSFPPASAMIASCEMARISMKMHAYFREKMINCVYKKKDIALFIPDWAKRHGMKEEDID